MATSGPTTGAPPAMSVGKDSWPEVVGMSWEEAKKIKEDKPEADVRVIPTDALITMDFNTGRVRVFHGLQRQGRQSSQGWLARAGHL
jgi:hypothetical protein